MSPTDHPTFIEAITQLSEALGSRALTQAGMKTWVQTLKEFPLPDIVTQLDGWAKRSTRMAAPADIWKGCNDMRTERIEQTAKSEAREFNLEADRTFRRSDRVGKSLRTLATELRDQEPTDPKEWAHTLWHRFVADRPNDSGEAMSQMQIQFACDALHRTVQDAVEARGNYRTARAA